MEYDGSRDRWKIDGDCDLCRRQKYCSKPCTLNVRREQYLLSRAVMRATVKCLLSHSKKSEEVITNE